eukprot:g449.t1
MVRETGQALERLGYSFKGSDAYREVFSRHRNVLRIYGKRPTLSNDTFVAPSAAVVGDVQLSDKTSVWYGAVVRGDDCPVVIGAATNIAERAVITSSARESLETGLPPRTEIGNYCFVGQGSTLYGCTVQNGAYIGANCVIGDGAMIEEMAIVEDGSVIPPGARIPKCEVWGGSGDKLRKIRNVTDTEKKTLLEDALTRADAAQDHAMQFLPYGTLYRDAEVMRAQGIDV